MGSYGFTIEMTRITEGDATELWYEMKEAIVRTIWSNTHRLNGFKSYLNDESFHVNMSDRRDTSETSLYFAFWEEDVDGVIVDYAIHIALVSIAHFPVTYRTIAAKYGFELSLAGFDPEAMVSDHFAKHGNNICRVVPWKRGQPVDDMPAFVACEHRNPKLTASETTKLRAAAMSGLCACPCCRRGNKLDASIAHAWAKLDADATGIPLLDEPAVLGDWFEQRGVILIPKHVAAIARTYKAAI